MEKLDLLSSNWLVSNKGFISLGPSRSCGEIRIGLAVV
jgi:hypothetical protein